MVKAWPDLFLFVSNGRAEPRSSLNEFTIFFLIDFDSRLTIG